MLNEGEPFPDFALPDQDGNLVTLASLRGQKAVVYFYPKDDTPGCTTEACGFRDAAPPGAKVIGVSPDPVKSHKKFAEKFDLGFVLLSDSDHRLSEAVGVWVEKSMYGKKYMGVARTTFILDEDGIVRKVFREVKPQGHAAEVAQALA
ncbi:MAG TPA: thioredoxin-dependent thiol peroxidase [Fimbriimonas sp.]